MALIPLGILTLYKLLQYPKKSLFNEPDKLDGIFTLLNE